MKRSLALVLGLLIMLSACNGGGAATSGTGSSAPATPGSSTASSSGAADCTSGDMTGVTADTITLGNTNILSGPIAFIGEDSNQAFQVPIDALNKAGGVFGRQIKLVSYDDAYTPAQALTGTRRLIEQDKIFAWAGGVGTPTYLAVVPLLEQAKVPAITPFAPARSIGTMDHPLTYMTWNNFIDEYFNTASYLVAKEGMGTTSGDVAFVRFDTEHGEDALNGTNKALESVGKKVILDIPTTPEQTDYSGVALQLKNSGAKWLGFQLSSENGGNLLKAMKEIGYEPKKFTQSDYSDASFVKNFPDVSEGVYGGLQVRTFETPVNPVLQKHEDELKAATGQEMTTWRAVGTAQGLLTAEALKNMKAPTRECLIEALQAIKDFDTGVQAPITFGPDKRIGVSALGVFQIQDGKVVIVKPFGN